MAKQGDVSSDRPHYGPKADPREMSEKELTRWRAAYANAAKPCLCKELLDHIAAQAKQLAAEKQAREKAEVKVVEVRQGRTDAYACIVRVEAERETAIDDRNNLLNELNTLQCDIASALGWDMKGELWVEAIRRMLAERDALLDLVLAYRGGMPVDEAGVKATLGPILDAKEGETP